MGYQTEYTLEIRTVPTHDDYERIRKTMEEPPYDLIYYAFDQGWWNEKNQTAYFYSWDSVKWYDHKDQMAEISKMFPDYVFRLYGVGEDHNDMWYEYYRNGEYEECAARITYPEPENIKWPEAVMERA